MRPFKKRKKRNKSRKKSLIKGKRKKEGCLYLIEKGTNLPLSLRREKDIIGRKKQEQETKAQFTPEKEEGD